MCWASGFLCWASGFCVGLVDFCVGLVDFCVGLVDICVGLVDSIFTNPYLTWEIEGIFFLLSYILITLMFLPLTILRLPNLTTPYIPPI